MDTPESASAPPYYSGEYLGLAPFLRMSIEGADMSQAFASAFEQLQQDTLNPNRWMNLATLAFSLGDKTQGQRLQDEALKLSRIYTIKPLSEGDAFRLLVLMAPGDLAANMPLDCLLEGSGINIIHYFVTDPIPFEVTIPDHDAVMVGLSESDDNHYLLTALSVSMHHWPRPVLNAANKIPNVGRERASHLLQGIPGLSMPATLRLQRDALHDSVHYPAIIRPVDSHAGHLLARLEDRHELSAYLAKVADEAFFLSRFIDYRSEDGRFRKYRIALLRGRPFICHMAISSDWMIHYVNAGMYEDVDKREEECACMAMFEVFAKPYETMFRTIYERTGLDYLCLDCALTAEGEWLIFEIDHAMVVHAMDPEALFPYKSAHIARLQSAFAEWLHTLKT